MMRNICLQAPGGVEVVEDLRSCCFQDNCSEPLATLFTSKLALIVDDLKMLIGNESTVKGMTRYDSGWVQEKISKLEYYFSLSTRNTLLITRPYQAH